MRVLRVLLGVVAILVALPLLLGGVTLWAAMQHRADDGSFTAPLAPIHTGGYAVVVPDVDALLRQEAPFVRGGETTLRFTARTTSGPAFIGLAPRAAVAHYLAGVGSAEVTRVRLARGGLPVTLTAQPGGAPPSPPIDQTFWTVSSSSGTLFWSPSSVRGERLALVVMAPDARPTGDVSASAAMMPRWLDPTAWGLLILGTVAFLIGMVLLFWPRRQREIVYVVEPSQVPEIAARLGISTEPLAAALGGEPPGLDLFGEPAPAVSAPDPASARSSASTPSSSGGLAPTRPDPPAAAGPLAGAWPVEPPAWLVEPDRVAIPAPFWAGPTPVPAVPVAPVQAGTYRSQSAPPTITPSFVWPPEAANTPR